MTDLATLLIALVIFLSFYLAYFIFRNKLKGKKAYPILINCIVAVLFFILILDAIKNGSKVFILLLMMAISVKKLIDEIKKRRHS